MMSRDSSSDCSTNLGQGQSNNCSQADTEAKVLVEEDSTFNVDTGVPREDMDSVEADHLRPGELQPEEVSI